LFFSWSRIVPRDGDMMVLEIRGYQTSLYLDVYVTSCKYIITTRVMSTFSCFGTFLCIPQ